MGAINGKQFARTFGAGRMREICYLFCTYVLFSVQGPKSMTRLTGALYLIPVWYAIIPSHCSIRMVKKQGKNKSKQGFCKVPF
jgi:hypothetical protein